MKIVVREIGQEDIASYRNLRLRGLEDHPEAFGETADQFRKKSLGDIESKLKISNENGGFILGAFLGDTLLGTVALGREISEKSRHRSILWGMYVLPECRGKQIGAKLVELLIAKSQGILGLEQIHLAVTVGNTPALKLYEQFGFRIYGTDPKVLRVNSVYFDEYLMVRHLNAG